MSLYHRLRKCTAGYKLSRLQEKIDQLMYMDDSKLFAKNLKELETQTHAVRIYSQDVGMKIWQRKICHASNEKWQTTSDGLNGTTKSRQD